MPRKEAEYDILEDTFCLYCQRQFTSPKRLQNHVALKHPGSYADISIQTAKEKKLVQAAKATSQGKGK
jgi:hypothetical protein